AGPALQEQHLVVRWYGQQRAQILLGLLGHADEGLAAVADFHHRHAAALPVRQFGLHLLQHFKRQRCRAGSEVEYAHQGASAPESPAGASLALTSPAPSSAAPDSNSSPRLSTRSTPVRRSPSSRRIRRTPCVLRPTMETSLTGVRTSVPLELISISSCPVETCSAATTSPLRSVVCSAITPWPPRPC